MLSVVLFCGAVIFMVVMLLIFGLCRVSADADEQLAAYEATLTTAHIEGFAPVEVPYSRAA